MTGKAAHWLPPMANGQTSTSSLGCWLGWVRSTQRKQIDHHQKSNSSFTRLAWLPMGNDPPILKANGRWDISRIQLNRQCTSVHFTKRSTTHRAHLWRQCAMHIVHTCSHSVVLLMLLLLVVAAAMATARWFHGHRKWSIQSRYNLRCYSLPTHYSDTN